MTECSRQDAGQELGEASYSFQLLDVGKKPQDHPVRTVVRFMNFQVKDANDF